MVLLLFGGGGSGDEEDVTDADEGGCGGGWVVFVVIVVDAVGRTIRGAEGGEIDDGGGGCGCTAAMLPLWNVTMVESFIFERNTYEIFMYFISTSCVYYDLNLKMFLHN